MSNGGKEKEEEYRGGRERSSDRSDEREVSRREGRSRSRSRERSRKSPFYTSDRREKSQWQC